MSLAGHQAAKNAKSANFHSAVATDDLSLFIATINSLQQQPRPSVND
jgi:hypothetical protein